MLHIILVRPEHPGNIGAVARAMKNFEVSSLVLVDSQCDHLSEEARNRAKHAQEILQKAKIVKRIPKMDYLISTSGKMGSQYSRRSPYTPEEIVSKLPKNKQMKVGLMFGPESKGLLNTEIAKADFNMTIPANPSYGILNLSHAVTVVLYEFYKKGKVLQEPASSKDMTELLKVVNGSISRIGFTEKRKRDTQKVVWKRVLKKAFLSKREAFILFGFFRRIK